MVVNAVLAWTLGGWLALWPGYAVNAYGVSGDGTYAPIAMLRLLGVVVFALGLLCWICRSAAESQQHQVAGTLFAFFVPATLLIWIQQIAIWDFSVAGWVTVAVFVLNGVAFGAFFWRGSRAGGYRSQPPAAPPTAGDRANAARS